MWGLDWTKQSKTNWKKRLKGNDDSNYDHNSIENNN